MSDIIYEELEAELTGLRLRVAELEQQDQHHKVALQDSESRNLALLGAIPDIIFCLTREGIYAEFVRAERFRSYSVPVNELVGKHLYDVVSPELADEFLKLIAAALDTGRAQLYEYALTFDDGTVQEYEARVVACGENEVLAMIRDITERKRSERELRMTRDQLEQQNRHLNRVIEFVSLTLDQMTDAARRGATHGEFVNYLNQARSQFDRLH